MPGNKTPEEKFQSRQTKRNTIAAATGLTVVSTLIATGAYFIYENTRAPEVNCTVVSVSRDAQNRNLGRITLSSPVLPRKFIMAGFDDNHKQIDFQVAQQDPSSMDTNNYTFDASAAALPIGTHVVTYARLQEDQPPQCGDFAVAASGDLVLDQK